jgi:hypothetical protein
MDAQIGGVQRSEGARRLSRLLDGPVGLTVEDFFSARAEVRFIAFTHRHLLDTFSASALHDVRDHAAKICERFDC